MAQYKVVVSDRAKTMLGTHIKFIAQVSPVAARDTKTRLLNSIRSLSSMPDRCPFFDNELLPRNKYHKLFVEKWYLVLYQIKDKTVYVDYIVDCRQDYNWLVR